MKKVKFSEIFVLRCGVWLFVLVLLLGGGRFLWMKTEGKKEVVEEEWLAGVEKRLEALSSVFLKEDYDFELSSESAETKEVLLVEIINANGTPGVAGVFRERLEGLGGFKVDSLRTAEEMKEGAVLRFKKGLEKEVEKIGEILKEDYPVFEEEILETGIYDLVIVLGL